MLTCHFGDTGDRTKNSKETFDPIPVKKVGID